MTDQFMSVDQVKALLAEQTEAITVALKAVNTVDDTARPPAVKAEVPAFHRKRGMPSLNAAYKALKSRNWDKAGFEQDVMAAARELWDPKQDWEFAPLNLFWYKSPQEARDLFEFMGERQATKELDRVDAAIKAMTESLTVSITGGTAGGLLVPPEFAQDLFAYALTPQVALRRVPGIATYPASSNIVRFPRETTRAGASQAAEAGTLSSADATLAAQQIVVEKQYAFRRWSSELAADAQPAFSTFLNRTVVRDLGVQCDIQYLRGTGSTPQITGVLNYSSLTTGPSLGTNGRSVTHDDFIEGVYLLEAANVTNPDFVIAHPRTLNTLRKSKDGVGRYQWTPTGVPLAGGAPGAPDLMVAGYLPAYKTTNLTITETAGSNTDCSTAIVGDSSQVMIVERAGIEIAFSEHLYFTTDEIAVRALIRSAIVILQPAAVTLITGIRA